VSGMPCRRQLLLLLPPPPPPPWLPRRSS